MRELGAEGSARQFKRYAATLERELGVAPDAETQALAKEIARMGSASEPDTPEGMAEAVETLPI